MNKCEKCGHESDDDVTNHQSHDREWRIWNHWYCSKCKWAWFVVEEPLHKQDEGTEFNYGATGR